MTVKEFLNVTNYEMYKGYIYTNVGDIRWRTKLTKEKRKEIKNTNIQDALNIELNWFLY